MTDTIQPSSIPIPIFTGKKYDFWSIKMKTFFCSQDLWDIVEEGFTVAVDTSALTPAQKKEWKEKQQKDSTALFILQQAVADTIFPVIMGATSAKEAWCTLQEKFRETEKERAIKLKTLRRKFKFLKMKDSENVKDYYSKLKDIVSQMRAYGDTILDKKIVEKILISISDKYDSIVTTIEQTKDLSTLSVTELIDSLEAYEQRLRSYDENSIENVFQSKLKLRPQNQGEGRKKYGRENFRSKENSRIFSRNYHSEHPLCCLCKGTNHEKKYCHYHRNPQCRHCKRFGRVENYNKNKHQTNFVEENDCKQHLF